MAEFKIAMISSTVRDLPEHREKVRDACLRQEFFPSMMENWPAMDADGVTASLEKVEKADVYIGVFGFRYNYIPVGSEISITEMEYNRAVERKIPRLIFLMDEEHPVTVQGVERGPNAEKLENLRKRLKSERTVSLFKSPEDLCSKVIDSLSNLKRDRAMATTPVQLPVSSYDPRYPIFFVPFRAKGSQVVGRRAALEAVRNQLEHGHRTAIGQTASFAGLGGLGKTQLAVEYAYSFRDQYPNGVIWISADQDIDRQLIEIGVRAQWFPPESEHKDKLAIARQRFKNYSHVLIIFDNLQDAEAIAEYLPEPEARPHVLITSRSEHGGFVPVPLDLLDVPLSLELLIQESGRKLSSESEQRAAKEIAEKLGGLPLALELAGAYLLHRPTTWEQYRDLLTHNLKAALPAKFLQGSFTRHESDLYSTLRVNSEIFSEEPLLKDILDVLTWSGPGPMGISLLSKLLDVPETNLTNALGLGRSLRLLQKIPSAELYSIHQLIREVRREDVPLDQRNEWTVTIAERLAAWFQKHKRNFSDLPKFESEIEHLSAWYSNLSGRSPKLASRLIWLQAYPPFHRGRYTESLSLLLKSKGLLEGSGETDHDLEGNLFTDLCTINVFHGEYPKAKEYGLAAVEIRLKLLGEKNADTAMSLNNLGAATRAMGDPKSALEYCQRALKIWQELQGEKHIDTALALDNMGAAHMQLGNRELALDYAIKALAVRQEVLGLKHPDTASSLSSVGNAYLEVGKFKEALECQQRSLEISEELFGRRSVLTAYGLKNMGLVYHRTGNFGAALKCFEDALTIRRELFGDTHPDTVRVVADYAFTLCRVNRVHRGHELIDEWATNFQRNTCCFSGLKIKD